jgi:hypothetical protein
MVIAFRVRFRFFTVYSRSPYFSSIGRSVRNPKIHLLAEMILGLLDELHGDQSSVVRGFLAVLQDHPVVVHKRASVPPLRRSTESESAEPTGSSKDAGSTDALEPASEGVFEDAEHATRKRTRGGWQLGN